MEESREEGKNGKKRDVKKQKKEVEDDKEGARKGKAEKKGGGVENKELGCGTVLTSAPQELHAELPGP